MTGTIENALRAGDLTRHPLHDLTGARTFVEEEVADLGSSIGLSSLHGVDALLGLEKSFSSSSSDDRSLKEALRSGASSAGNAYKAVVATTSEEGLDTRERREAAAVAIKELVECAATDKPTTVKTAKALLSSSHAALTAYVRSAEPAKFFYETLRQWAHITELLDELARLHEDMAVDSEIQGKMKEILRTLISLRTSMKRCLPQQAQSSPRAQNTSPPPALPSRGSRTLQASPRGPATATTEIKAAGTPPPSSSTPPSSGMSSPRRKGGDAAAYMGMRRQPSNPGMQVGNEDHSTETSPRGRDESPRDASGGLSAGAGEGSSSGGFSIVKGAALGVYRNTKKLVNKTAQTLRRKEKPPGTTVSGGSGATAAGNSGGGGGESSASGSGGLPQVSRSRGRDRGAGAGGDEDTAVDETDDSDAATFAGDGIVHDANVMLSQLPMLQNERIVNVFPNLYWAYDFFNQEVTRNGVVYVTNADFGFLPDDADTEGFRFALQMISSITKVGKKVGKAEFYHIVIQCHDFRSFRLGISKVSDQRTHLYEHLASAVFVDSVQQFFAFQRERSSTGEGWSIYNADAEMARQFARCKDRIGQAIAWRPMPNRDYYICSTYPKMLCVPKSVSDDLVANAALFRSRGRFPALSYLHTNGRVICRAAQPMVGIKGNRSNDDEELLEAIRCSASPADTLIIYDARPKANAVANQAMGKGFESEKLYKQTRLCFLKIANIHVMRDSLRILSDVVTCKDSQISSVVTNSGWLDHLRRILVAAVTIAGAVHVDKFPCLVHCLSEDHEVLTSDGFLGLQQLLQRGDAVQIASYDERKQEVVYERADRIVVNPRLRYQMVEVSSRATNGVSLLVTDQHDLYVNGRMMRASDLFVSSQNSGSGFSMITAAGNGFQGDCTAATALCVEKASTLKRYGAHLAQSVAEDFDAAVWTLPRDAARCVLEGMCESASHERLAVKELRISCGGCLKRQDNVVRLALHAGFSPRCVGGDVVLKSDAAGAELFSPDSVRQSVYDGIAWCVTVPSGKIIVRRRVANETSQPVVVGNCSDGWDRTAQLTSLAMLLLDPFYRTLRGFQVLIEKEWLSFGHQFAQRTGHSVGHMSNAGDQERSPVFLQFVDCVFQLTKMAPCSFEFNEHFLVDLLDAVYSCHYGTFLFDSEREREEEKLREKTESFWAYVNSQQDTHFLYSNVLYDPESDPEVVLPEITSAVLWNAYFLRFRERGLKEKQRHIIEPQTVEAAFAVLKERLAKLEAQVQQQDQNAD